MQAAPAATTYLQPAVIALSAQIAGKIENIEKWNGGHIKIFSFNCKISSAWWEVYKLAAEGWKIYLIFPVVKLASFRDRQNKRGGALSFGVLLFWH